MKKSLYLILLLLFISSCTSNTHLDTNQLTGKSYFEIIDLPSQFYLDSCLTTFTTNSTYKREIGIYTQKEGPYSINNDTLTLHYTCRKTCNTDSCGVQKYLLKSDDHLHLTFMRELDGKIIHIKDSPFSKKLEYCDSSCINNLNLINNQ